MGKTYSLFAAQRGVVFDPVARGNFLTLFVAFVPLLWIQSDVAAKTGRKGKPLRFWPYAVATFTLWWLATVWWVGFAAVIGVVAATVTGTVLMSGGLSDLPCRLAQGQTGAGLHGVGQRLDRLRISFPERRDLVPVAGARQRSRWT